MRPVEAATYFILWK